MIGLKITVICYVLHVLEAKDNLVTTHFLHAHENKGYMSMLLKLFE